MIITETRVLCDRCGNRIDSTYGKTWELFKAKKKYGFKLEHDVPCWNRTDTFHLCDECANSFKKWLDNDNEG